jgi:hypothetical protein
LSDKNNGQSWWENTKTQVLPYYNSTTEFAKTERGKLIGKFFSYLIQAGIIIYLIYELTQIGWGNFFAALPVTPYFYLLFLVIYSALPFTEILCYMQSWKIGFWESVPIYIKKRVYNKSFIGYSGEVVVFAWARRKDLGDEKEIFRVIRDNNIVSSLASTSVVFALLLIFILSGQIAFIDHLTNQYSTFTIVSTVIIVLILAIVAYQNRKYFFSMPRRIAITVFSFHTIRLIVINVVQVFIWHLVMPEVSWTIWFTFLSVQLIISRIPFLPSRDLFYIGASLEVSQVINFSTAGIAGLLIAQNVLDKILNVALFTAISLWESKKDNILEMAR